MAGFFAPIGGMEFQPHEVPSEELQAIVKVLAKRGENRSIVKLWWVSANTGYYILIETPGGEETSTHFVSLASVVEAQNSE